MTAIDLASFAGLTAMVLLTVNLLLGLLVATNCGVEREWPHRKLPVPLFRIHNWIAYAAISVAILHPLLLLFVEKPKFYPRDIVFPLWSPGQTLYNCLGAITGESGRSRTRFRDEAEQHSGLILNTIPG